MARAARPEDLYRFRIPTSPRLSPDASLALVTLQTVAPKRDGYRHALWAVPLDGGGAARQLTLGHRHDRAARFSPDGTRLAFLSDRRASVEEEPAAQGDRPDLAQVYLLPLAGGEARRLTDLPAGARASEWSPDGRSLVVVTSSRAAGPARPRRAAGPEPSTPESDYRYIDRLGYMLTGEGFIYNQVTHVWLVDVETGASRQLTRGASPEASPAWSPDGSRIAFAANRRRDFDLLERSDIFVVDVASGRVTRLTGGEMALFRAPEWLPDGTRVAALGHRFPAAAGSRTDIWLFPADGSDAGPAGGRNLSAVHDLMPDAGMNSDLTPGEGARLVASADGRWLSFTAPVDGSQELWRIATDSGRVERLTNGRHYVSSFDQVTGSGVTRLAFLRSDPVHLSDLYVIDLPDDPGFAAARTATPSPRRVTSFNDEALAEVELVTPVERWVTVDGRRIQGWYYPATAVTAASGGSAPLVTEIHGGPHSLYGWAPAWEFQVLAGYAISVYCSNPRGSTGYGQDFNAANFRDWGDGPTRDVLAGIDALVAEGLADPDRLGLTGGSYGGYLTTWMVAHDQRFRAALAARSVSDMTTLMLTGDISGGEFGRQEFGVAPWEDPAYYREISPISYAGGIRTPLLIQHSENDIRTTIAQGEALFTVLRSLRRPVRFMRVPEETHELTRSGTPFRRVENLVQVRSWFHHFLVEGKTGLPRQPKPRRR